MDINELKSTWEKSEGPRKNQEELQWMTKLNNHSKLRRVKLKLIIESVSAVVFLGFYYDMLDGGNKPLWLNCMLLLSVILLVGNHILGYMTLLNPVQGKDIAKSLQNFKMKLKRVMIMSMLAAFTFGVSLILFLTIGVHFSPAKYVLLIGMVVTFFVMTYMSYSIWSARLRQLEQSASEFEIHV